MGVVRVTGVGVGQEQNAGSHFCAGFEHKVSQDAGPMTGNELRQPAMIARSPMITRKIFTVFMNFSFT
jgi:hypothetical protein